MQAILCWQGGKKSMLKELLRRVPPHSVYIEPFFGAGHLYWAKSPAETEIINDIDPQLMAFYRDMAKKPRFDCDMTPDRAKWERIRELRRSGKKITACDFLFAVKYAFRCDASKSYAPNEAKICNASPNPKHCQVTNTVAHFPEYQERLRNTRIYNEDWKAVVKRHDCKGGFIFCDPPYVETDCNYHTCSVNPQEIADFLAGLKCRWMVTLNDHPAVHKAFKGRKIERVQALYSTGNYQGTKWSPNLIIRNFEGFYDGNNN